MIDNYCLNCARKHLARANIRMYEFLSGAYPSEFWLALGEMSLAEDHVILIHPEIAEKIREERKKTEEEENYYPNIISLIDIITEVALQEDAEDSAKDIQTNDISEEQ